MVALVFCKNEEDPIKNEGTEVLTTFLLLKVYENFFRRSRKAANSAIRGQIGLKFKLVRDFMVVLLNCKKEEDPFKNEGASANKIIY